jgi:hypothetical protein
MKRLCVLPALACVAMFVANTSAQSTGQVTINVMDFTGAPASHAWVAIRPIGFYHGHHVHQYVSTDGAMTKNLAPGSYTVYAHHVGIGSGTVSFSVLPGQSVNVNVLLNSGHYYGYYHWYRIHRVGVSHFARTAHQARQKALAANPTDAHGRHAHQRTTTPKNANDAGTSTGSTRGVTGSEPVDEPQRTAPPGAVHRSIGNEPAVGADEPHAPVRSGSPGGGATFQPHVGPARPSAPPVHVVGSDPAAK